MAKTPAGLGVPQDLKATFPSFTVKDPEGKPESGLDNGSKVPKSVQVARELTGHYAPIAEDLLKLDGKVLNAVGCALRQSMTPENKQQYAAFKTGGERRSWMAKFISDPKVSK